jgi:hypothetical protein
MDKIDFSFKAFEAILTYAVDEISDTNAFNILKDINFGEDSFFTKLYVNREKEVDFKKELLKDTSQILIKGYPGTGKTTLLRKVLRDFETEEKAFVLYIDFKKLEQINNSKNSNQGELSKFIEEYLTSRIINYLNLCNIDSNDVTDFLVTEREYINSQDFNNPAFINILSQLQSLHNFDDDDIPDFLEWFQSQRTTIKSNQFKSHYLLLSQSLKAHNYIYYLAYSNKKQSGQRLCIICYDNVDSIIDNKVRDTFCQYFRQYQQITKIAAKSVISMRTDNSSVKLLSDANAYIVSKIDVTYDDFIDQRLIEREKEEHKKQYGIEPDPESVNDITLKLIKRATEVFTKTIYEQRSNYVKKEINEENRRQIENVGRNETIDIEKIKQIEEIFRLILNDNRVREAFLDLCNNDRRKMLIYKTNFVNYLLNEVGLDSLDIDHFKLEKDSIQFIMESYFYGWMNRSNKFYDDEIYNFPKDLKKWSSHQNHIGCSLDHLIFSVIYNLSNQSISVFSYDKFTTVGELLTKLQEIGYNKEDVLKRLFSIYKDNVTNESKGLIEVSRFYEIDSENKFRDEDEIGLTPKSFYLTKYSSLKFISIISSIRSHSIKERNGEFSYDDKHPITPQTVEGCLKFLCELAKMHLCGLYHAKSHSEKIYSNEWFSHYKKIFCVEPNVRSSKHLLFENLINSIILFLERQKIVDRERKIASITKEMVGEYEKLQGLFAENLKKLVDGDFQNVAEIRAIKFCDQLNFNVFAKLK